MCFCFTIGDKTVETLYSNRVFQVDEHSFAGGQR